MTASPLDSPRTALPGPPATAQPGPPAPSAAERRRQQQAACAAAEALRALETPWHLAVVGGPDTGVVIALPAGGSVIGRGGLLSDPALSRTHCELEASARTVRLTACHSPTRRRRLVRWWRVRPGSRLREGHRLRLAGTVLELRRQPVRLHVPAPRPPRSGRWLTVLTVVSMLAACVGVGVAVWFQRSSGTRLPLGALTGIPVLALMGIRLLASAGQGRTGWDGRGRGRRRVQGWDGRRPDPAGMLLGLARRCLSGPGPAPHDAGAASPPGGSAAPGPPVSAWAGRRCRRWLLRLDPGATVVLRGRAAPAWGLWWTVQVVASGQGHATCRGAGVEDGLLIRWGTGSRQSPPPAGASTPGPAQRRPATSPGEGTPASPWCGVVQPAGPDTLPAATTHLARVPRRGPGTSPSWQAAALQLIERASSGAGPSAAAAALAGTSAALPDAAAHPGRTTSSPHGLSEDGLPDSVDLTGLVGSRRRDDVLRLWARWDEKDLRSQLEQTCSQDREEHGQHDQQDSRVRRSPQDARDRLKQADRPDQPGWLGLADQVGRLASGSRPTSSTAPNLTAVLGVRQTGSGPSRAPATVEVDLARQGPHALVAGTTGAGKSDLLTAWLLQLAALNPPDRLSLVLVDYKGGAAFGPLERLPHTAGVLTDLDPALTTRALASLQAEEARRERLLARLGCKDAAHLPPGQRLPAVVIVVDEFATLAHSHPEVLDGLVRVAAQGRSLGLHLVLATQRPAGAVSPAVRANTSLRLCLRVLEETDSRDVLGTSLAAHLSPVPGRLVIADASGRMEVAQAPWCGPEGEVAAQVEAVVAAADALGSAHSNGHQAWRPWAPPLPEVVRRSELPALENPGRADLVPLALLDDPDHQRTLTWAWDPARPLLVLAAPGTGRTTALLSAALGFHQRTGAPVHLVGTAQDWERALAAVLARPGTESGSPDTDPANAGKASGISGTSPGSPNTAPDLTILAGTRIGPDDPRRLARLLDLARSGELAGSLLVVDDAASLIDAVDHSRGPGEGLVMWEALCRQAAALGTALVVGASLASASARWAAALTTRLVLGALDPAQAALAGLPRGWVCAAGNGRGVLVEGSEPARACQVCLPDTEEPGPPERTGAHEDPPRRRRDRAQDGPPEAPQEEAQKDPCAAAQVDPQAKPQADHARGSRTQPGAVLAPIPLTPYAPGAWAVGGDRASPLPLPGGHVLVLGPAGSGRSTALEALASCLRRSGHRPLILDDADLATPEQVSAAQQALEQGHQVLASATAASAAATYRGLLAQLRERAALVVLWPGLCPPGGLTSVDLRPASDPAYPTWPGRGVIVERGQVLPLQVVPPSPPSAQTPGKPATAPRRATHEPARRPYGDHTEAAART